MKKYKVPPIPGSVWRNPLHFIAFGFGAGALPVMPGTFGTLVGVGIYWLLQMFLAPWVYFFVVLACVMLSMWICEKVSSDIAVQDHQGMCLDEIVGFLVTMLFVPFSWMAVILGFVLFRVFDIVKPWPINMIDEKVHGGVGMVLDDVVAGIFSCALLHIIKII